MSNTIDKRVVEMGFDNKQFESGVKTSLDTISELKKGLQFNESYGRGLGGLSGLLNGLPLGGISEGVENISSKFSILGAIGFTAIQTLTNSAINLARKLWDVVSPINAAKQGLSEYEIQINAIQTILANTSAKGTTMDQVNVALEQLNKYADKTIYNFSEMTRNIGTFTAAGIDLDTSVAAIKGIANLAAVSGSNSQQAATAMYQLSQALSTGTVRLMDWNSVVNAGMGGQVFQDALKETARAHGIAVDKIIKQEGSFRESLSKGWLTSSVLTETLSKFTGDLNAEQLKTMGYTEDQIRAIIKLGQTANDAATKVKTFSQLKETLNEAIGSGWARTWQIIVGDFEEAKGFFTEVSDTLGKIINDSADSRNTFLQTWKDMGGRTALVMTLKSAFEAIMSVVEPVKEALREIFPPATAANLYYITLVILNFVRGLKLTALESLKVKIIFRGLFAFFDIVKMAVLALIKPFLDLAKSIIPAGSGIVDFLIKAASYFIRLREGIKLNDTFNKAVQKFVEYIKIAIGIITAFALGIKKAFDIVKPYVMKYITIIAGLFVAFVDLIKGNLDLIKPYLDKVKGIIVNFFSTSLTDRFKGMRESLTNIFAGINTDAVDTFFDKFGKRFEPLRNLAKIVVSAFQRMIGMFTKLLPTFNKISEKASDTLTNFVKSIGDAIVNMDFSHVFDTINAGVFTAILLAIKGFISKGSKSLDGFTGIFDSIKGVFTGITGVFDGVRKSLEVWQQNLKAKTLLLIAGAIALLTVSLIALSMIDSVKLTTALLAITALFADLMGSMAAYNKIMGPTGGVGATTSIVVLAVALLIMAGAVSKLAKIDPKDVEKALALVAALTISLIGFAKTAESSSGKIIKTAAGLILLSVGLNVLAGVVEKLGKLDPIGMTNGLIAVGVMLAELAVFMNITDFNKLGIGKAAGLLLMTGAMLILAKVVEKFGDMDPSKIKVGLVAIAGILGELAIFTKITGDGKNIIATSIGITIIAAAMLIFTDVITKLAEMSWNEIGRGLAAMGGGLLLVVMAVNALPKDMIVKSIGLVLVAGALVILSNALNNLGDMSWSEVGIGLTALAASLAILAVAMNAMTGSIGGALALMIVAGALTLFVPLLIVLGTLPLAVIGVALLALAGAFLVLGVAGALLTPVVPTLVALGAAMLLIGGALALTGLGIMAFSAGLASLAVSGAAGALAIVEIAKILVGLVPMIITTIFNGIVQFAKLVIDNAPVIGKAFEAFFSAILLATINMIPNIVNALGGLLDALIKLIDDYIPRFIKSLLNLIGTLLTSLADKVPEFVQAGIDIILGLLKGIRDNIGEIVTVAIEIVTNFIDAVAEKIPDIIDSGFNLIISFIDGLAEGIDENVPELMAAVGRLADAIIQGLSDGLTSGVKGVAAAIGKIATAAVDALKLLLGIFSPSIVFTELGELTVEGFINGLNNLGSNVEKASENIGNKAINGLGEAVKSIKESLDTNMEFSPTIRPVVDLEDIVSKGKEINRILTSKALNVTGMVESNLSSISSGLSQDNITQDKSTPTSVQGASISFTQINNSPVPLSRLEIYRQTRNQLLSLKSALRGTT